MAPGSPSSPVEVRPSVAWLSRNRSPTAAFAFAFVLRAAQNLVVHPPLSDRHSDMGGYIRRAETLLRGDFTPDPGATFFPYGTHVLIFVLKWFFRGESSTVVSLAYAAIGAFAVAITVKTAQRLWPDRVWVHWALGVLLALEPAWIQLGSYALSETPTTLAIALSAYFSLRLVDEGKTRDAIWLGLTLAIGATFRPQVLMTVPFLALVFILRRVTFARLRYLVFAAILLPIAMILGASAFRTHYDTGQWGTISTNGPFNMVFGRCHCMALSARGSPGSRFEPPSLRALHIYKERHGVSPILDLDPAIAPELSFEGKIWETGPAYALARDCVNRTSTLRQLKYAVTHWVLLWGYNLPWPTDNLPAVIGTVATGILELPGFILALVLVWRRSRARELILVAHALGLLTTAAVFFGEARLRTPYDGVILTIALGVYGDLVARVRRRWREAKSEVGGGAPQLD